MSNEPWAHVLLGDVVDLVSGATPKGVTHFLIEGSPDPQDVPFFKVGDMNLDGTRLQDARVSVSPDAAEALKMRMVPVGAVVFPKAGGAIATNKKRIVTRAGAIDLNCMAAVPGADVDPGYLRLWFESLDLSKLSDGSVLPQLSKRTMAAVPFPLPSLGEQWRIVETLEDHLSRLDSAMAALHTAERRAAFVRVSFLRQQREMLLSEGVPLREVGELCETALGKMLDARRASGNPTPYLRNINVRWGSIDIEDVRMVPLTDQEQKRFALREGDVLVCEGGEPGRCAVWRGEPSPMTFQKALHRVRPKAAIASEFVAMMIEESVRSGRADRLFTGTTIKHLPQEKLREIRIPAPNAAQQSRSLARLAALDSGLEQVRSESSRAALRAASLRRSVLATAFEGRLVHGLTGGMTAGREAARA